MMLRWLAALFFLAPSVALAQAYYVGSGTFGYSATTPTCAIPSGVQADDYLLLIAESENETISYSTQASFSTLTQNGQGTAATDPSSRIAWAYKKAVGSDTAPVLADSGNHTTCVVHAFRNVDWTNGPYDGTPTVTVTTTGATYLYADAFTINYMSDLFVFAVSTSNNATSTANCGTIWNNTGVMTPTERFDQSNTIQLGGGSCLITGEITATGSVSANQLSVNMSSVTSAGILTMVLRGILVVGSGGMMGFWP